MSLQVDDGFIEELEDEFLGIKFQFFSLAYFVLVSDGKI